jgi:hypothetical protein
MEGWMDGWMDHGWMDAGCFFLFLVFSFFYFFLSNKFLNLFLLLFIFLIFFHFFHFFFIVPLFFHPPRSLSLMTWKPWSLVLMCISPLACLPTKPGKTTTLLFGSLCGGYCSLMSCPRTDQLHNYITNLCPSLYLYLLACLTPLSYTPFRAVPYSISRVLQ